MKIEVTCKNLKSALSKASHATLPKGSLPAIQCLHFSAENGTIRIAATDLDLYLTVVVDGDVVEDGAALIHPDKFKHILDSSDDIVRIETKGTEDSPTTKITIGKFRRESPSLSLKLVYGKIKMAETKEHFAIVGESLIDGLESVDKAVSTSEVNADYAITGVHFNISDENISLCSTNKQRVSLRKIQVRTHGVPKFTLPARTVDMIKRVVPVDADVEISATEKAVYLKWEGGELVTKTIEAKFPNVGAWLMIGMKDELGWCRVKRNSIIKPLERVSSVHDFTNIKVECKQGMMHLANDTDGKMTPDLAEDLVKLEAGAEVPAFFLKGGYLKDAILSCHEDEFEFAADEKAFVLRSKDLRYICVIAYSRIK